MSASLNLEAKAGITQFVHNHEGFFGIIKQRYSDFLVNEISADGTIVHFTSKEVIEPPSPIITKDLSKPEALLDVQVEIMKVMAGQKRPQELKPSLFLQAEPSFVKPPDDYSSLRIEVQGLSKEVRTSIHQFVKSNFTDLISSTKDISLKKYIIVSKKANNKNRDRRDDWPKTQNIVNFILYKENIDTMEAVNLLAGKLRLRPSMFCYAGTKDKRAKTSQKLSIQKVKPKNIASACNGLRGIYVGNFSFGSTPQKLGQLRGNHFQIVLREVSGTDDAIFKALSSLKANGFINYFGMQRFSHAEVPTHLIGKAILKCQWDEVCNLILAQRNSDTPDLKEAKKIWKTKRDPSAAFEALQRYKRSSIEGLLLGGLVRHGNNNAATAFEMIPRNTQLLYLHAYQSYIWNTVISRRIEKYGVKLLKGDLIRRNIKNLCSENLLTKSPTIEQCEDDLEMENDINITDEVNTKVDHHKNIHIVTDKEMEDIDISQVLMPLPGYDILYPENEIKSWYLELLEKDGLNFDSFKHKIKKYSLIGAYRRMLILPADMKYDVCFYDDPTKPLILSDLDIMNNVDVSLNKLPAGCHKAVIIEFSLQSSAYATMALRELLKMETSSAFQTSLNVKCNEEQQLHSAEDSFSNLKRKKSEDEHQNEEKKQKSELQEI